MALPTWANAPVRDGLSAEGVWELFDGSHRLWREFLDGLGEVHVLAIAELPIDANFRNSAGDEAVSWSEGQGHRALRPLWQSILHVVNHGTQHRTEIGMYLLSLGRSPGDLDYGTFEEYRIIRQSEDVPPFGRP